MQPIGSSIPNQPSSVTKSYGRRHLVCLATVLHACIAPLLEALFFPTQITPTAVLVCLSVCLSLQSGVGGEKESGEERQEEDTTKMGWGAGDVTVSMATSFA